MNTNAKNHFLQLAKDGQDPTASHGEWVCHKIAAALHELDDDLMLLDSCAAEGVAALLRAAAGPHSSTPGKDALSQMIEDTGTKGGRR